MNDHDAITLLKLVSDETRIKILRMLSESGLCACKILETLNITQPTLSYHMKILTESGLVSGVKDGIWMRYTLNKERLDQLSMFILSLKETAMGSGLKNPLIQASLKTNN
jgi:ArsR family transcriptional regulator